MISHLARFSVFVIVIMTSFALAFSVLFMRCYDENTKLDSAYGSLSSSILTMFQAMLGDFDFEVTLTNQ